MNALTTKPTYVSPLSCIHQGIIMRHEHYAVISALEECYCVPFVEGKKNLPSLSHSSSSSFPCPQVER